ncbi:MAG TPA: hypothetical protein VHB77_16275, partial [Planctomycetaceae bacterium]|nr:hypothetical protein [Planctomycetaceae bacterium]
MLVAGRPKPTGHCNAWDAHAVSSSAIAEGLYPVLQIASAPFLANGRRGRLLNGAERWLVRVAPFLRAKRVRQSGCLSWREPGGEFKQVYRTYYNVREKQEEAGTHQNPLLKENCSHKRTIVTRSVSFEVAHLSRDAAQTPSPLAGEGGVRGIRLTSPRQSFWPLFTFKNSASKRNSATSKSAGEASESTPANQPTHGWLEIS